MEIASDLHIDRRDERIFADDAPLKLGRKAYLLLLALADANGRLVTKDALFATVWPDIIVSEAALTSTVYELRRVLAEAGHPGLIETVYGRGYRLKLMSRKPGIPSSEDLHSATSIPELYEQAQHLLSAGGGRRAAEARALLEAALAIDRRAG